MNFENEKIDKENQEQLERTSKDNKTCLKCGNIHLESEECPNLNIENKTEQNKYDKVTIIGTIVIVIVAIIGVFLITSTLYDEKDIDINNNSSSNLKYITLKGDKIIPLNETRIVEVEFTPSYEKEKIVKWSSSNEEVAVVNNGVITSKSIGKAIITAETSSGIKSVLTIEVVKKIENFTINKENIELYIGETSELKVSVSPEDFIDKVIWTSSNMSIAEVKDGTVTAKSSGTAIITASIGGLTQECIINIKSKPIEFSGYGNKVISNINIPSGNYKAVLSNSGSSNFIVKFYKDFSEKYGDLLANEIGNYKGSVVIRDGETTSITDGMLEIKSSGNWKIRFEQIEGIISSPVSGNGDTVTGWFTGKNARNVAVFKNFGKSNFIVRMYDEYGNRDLLVNEIGAYNGQATFVTSSTRKYYFEITSSGEWSIDWE